jgi:hypothetical protein
MLKLIIPLVLTAAVCSTQTDVQREMLSMPEWLEKL